MTIDVSSMQARTLLEALRRYAVVQQKMSDTFTYAHIDACASKYHAEASAARNLIDSFSSALRNSAGICSDAAETHNE